MRSSSGLHLFSAIALAVLLSGCAARPEQASIQGGRLRLSASELAQSVRLAGEWELTWGELEEPGSPGPRAARELMSVPSYWTEGDRYPAVGCATLRLVVELPEHLPEPLGLYLTRISTAYRVYGNGILLAENGRLSTRPEEVRGTFAPRTVYLSAQGSLEIVIQVCNTDDVTAGMNAAPLLGYQSVIAPAQERETIIDAVIYASILAMALYHVLLSILHPAERASLTLGLLSLDLALRGTLTGSRIAHQLLGGIGFHNLIAAEYITVYAGALLVYLYFYQLFPEERPTVVRIPLFAVSALMSVFVLFAPISLITPVHLGYEVLLLALGVLIVVWLIRAMVSRRSGAPILLAGFMVLLGGTAYDVVVDVMDTGGLFVSSYAMLVFIFLQAALIARRYAGAFRSVERHSRRAEALATAYSRFVPQEFLALLGKESILNVELGDQIEMEMTVLFADIRSFTSLSENMSPAENFNFLNSYLKRISPVIRRHKGFIDKYLGDGIMALFPGSPADGLRAAGEVFGVMREYNRHRARSGYRSIQIGMGITTGRLMLGTVGEESRMEGTVISDVVNLASRLQTLTRTFGSTVIVSGAVLLACPDAAGLPFRHLGRARVKGKAQAVELCEIIDPEDEPRVKTRSLFGEAVRSFESGRYEDAVAGFETVLADDPLDAAARYYLGRLAQVAGTDTIAP